MKKFFFALPLFFLVACAHLNKYPPHDDTDYHHVPVLLPVSTHDKGLFQVPGADQVSFSLQLKGKIETVFQRPDYVCAVSDQDFQCFGLKKAYQGKGLESFAEDFSEIKGEIKKFSDIKQVEALTRGDGGIAVLLKNGHLLAKNFATKGVQKISTIFPFEVNLGPPPYAQFVYLKNQKVYIDDNQFSHQQKPLTLAVDFPVLNITGDGNGVCAYTLGKRKCFGETHHPGDQEFLYSNAFAIRYTPPALFCGSNENNAYCWDDSFLAKKGERIYNEHFDAPILKMILTNQVVCSLTLDNDAYCEDNGVLPSKNIRYVFHDVKDLFAGAANYFCVVTQNDQGHLKCYGDSDVDLARNGTFPDAKKEIIRLHVRLHGLDQYEQAE